MRLRNWSIDYRKYWPKKKPYVIGNCCMTNRADTANKESTFLEERRSHSEVFPGTALRGSKPTPRPPQRIILSIPIPSPPLPFPAPRVRVRVRGHYKLTFFLRAVYSLYTAYECTTLNCKITHFYIKLVLHTIQLQVRRSWKRKSKIKYLEM